MMDQETAAFDGRLHYVELTSLDPARLAESYGKVFGGMPRKIAASWILSAPDRVLMFSEGPAKAFRSAGYAVDAKSLAALARRAGALLEPAGGLGAELFEPGAVALRDPDGNRLLFGIPAPVDASAQQGSLPARLQHLVVASVQPDSMVDFYETVVGFRVSDRVRDEETGLRACFLRSDSEHHSFAVFRAAVSRLDHHCYELSDWNAIRDWGDRLAELRMEIKWGPGRHGPGNNLFCFFHDLDGNWLELSCELKRVTPDHVAGLWPHEERTLNLWGTAFLRG